MTPPPQRPPGSGPPPPPGSSQGDLARGRARPGPGQIPPTVASQGRGAGGRAQQPPPPGAAPPPPISVPGGRGQVPPKTPPTKARPGPIVPEQPTMETLSISEPAATSSSVVSGPSRTGSGDSSSVTSRTDIGRGTSRGGARQRMTVLYTRPDGRENKKGTTGNDLNIITNYFRVAKKPDSRLEQWRVDFTPDVDSMAERKALIKSLQATLGVHLFDGTVIYTMHKLGGGQDSLTFPVTSRNGVVQVNLKLVGEVTPQETRYMMIFGIILRKCMDQLKLKLIGREHFDDNPKARISIPKHNLELWPGYTTSIREHEPGPLLCVDTKFKIVRKDTALQMMKTSMANGGGRDAADRALVGQIVMTMYNNRTYKVSSIAWDKTPTSTFPAGNTQIPYIEYYEKKGIRITDRNQPLLEVKPRERVFRRGGDTGDLPCCLIPEHCVMTGLTEKQRGDFRLMSDVAQYTRTVPTSRIQALQMFAKRINDTKEVAEELTNWNLKIMPELQSIKGRSLPPQELIYAGNVRIPYKADNADWGGIFKKNKLFSGSRCDKWAVICFEKDESKANNFVKQVLQSGQQMGFMMAGPKYFRIPSGNQGMFGQTVQNVAKQGPSMVMAVTPNNKSTLYSHVKKICCVDHPIPSQVVTATILGKEKGLGSIAHKVAVQMAAKLGAEPWTVPVPLKDLMVVGYDTFHDAANKKKSVGGFVSTTNQSLSRFYSSAVIHENNTELLENLVICMRKALEAYSKQQGGLPNKILIYRDGVGESQIQMVLEEEVDAITKVLKRFDPTGSIKLTFSIVSKRINSRFYLIPGQNAQPTNPPAGTVIDDVVTLPERYDFFLIAQSVRQGTVNPTSYNVIKDEIGLPPDKLQLLTYRMCHMYYNWPGTIKVPAVCQYAHKLANLVGEHIHKVPSSDELGSLLYYL